MEALTNIRAIKLLKARLVLCEHIRSDPAQEVLSRDTCPLRRIEALVDRASLQSKSADLLRQLEELQSLR